MDVDEFLRMYNEYKTTKAEYDLLANSYTEMENQTNNLIESLDLNFQKEVDLNTMDRDVLNSILFEISFYLYECNYRKDLLTKKGDSMNKKLRSIIAAFSRAYTPPVQPSP